LIVSRAGRQVAVTLPITLRASDWSQKMQRVKASAPGGHKDGEPVHVTDLNAELDRIRLQAQRLTLAYPDDADLRDALLEMVGTKPKETEPTLLDRYAAFLEYRRKRVKESTMEVYEALEDHLKAFAGKRTLKVTDIGRGLLADFQTHLIKSGQNNSTANKYTSRLRTFFRWLKERGEIDSVPSVKPLKTAQSHVVRLTAEELAALRDVDLTDAPEGHRAARDLFLLLTYTGQRVSDVYRMEWKDIRGDAWYMTEAKTGVVRRIPLPAPALAIIETNRGRRRPVPKLSEQRLNDYIKQVGQRAGIDAPVTLRSQRGGHIEETTAPKWEVLSSHVGRKTYISLMMEAGLSPKEMLGVTHSDLRSLRHYAAASEKHLRQAHEAVFGKVAP